MFLSPNQLKEKHPGKKVTTKLLSRLHKQNRLDRDDEPERKGYYRYDEDQLSDYFDALENLPAVEIPDDPRGHLIWLGLLTSDNRYKLTPEQRRRRRELRSIYGGMGDSALRWARDGCPAFNGTGRKFLLIAVPYAACPSSERVYVVKADLDDVVTAGQKPKGGFITRADAISRVGCNILTKYSDCLDDKRRKRRGEPYPGLGHTIGASPRLRITPTGKRWAHWMTDFNEADIEFVEQHQKTMVRRTWINPDDGLSYALVKEAAKAAAVFDYELGQWRNTANPNWGGLTVRAVPHETARRRYGKLEPRPAAWWYCLQDCRDVATFKKMGKLPALETQATRQRNKRGRPLPAGEQERRRDVLARGRRAMTSDVYTERGKQLQAFCQVEGISVQTFHKWTAWEIGADKAAGRRF